MASRKSFGGTGTGTVYGFGEKLTISRRLDNVTTAGIVVFPTAFSKLPSVTLTPEQLGSGGDEAIVRMYELTVTGFVWAATNDAGASVDLYALHYHAIEE